MTRQMCAVPTHASLPLLTRGCKRTLVVKSRIGTPGILIQRLMSYMEEAVSAGCKGAILT